MHRHSGVFRESRKGSIVYYESPALAAFGFIAHAFCSRNRGVSEGPYKSLNFSAWEGDSEETVQNNFQITAQAFGFSPRQFLAVRQIHGAGILVIDRPDALFNTRKPLEYDGIITDQPELAICIKTADCVPLFLVDRVRKVIGAIHAGWRGTALNIAAKAVDAFVNRFASRTEDLLVAVGPAIGPCCYEVDRQVLDAMDELGKGEQCFRPCVAHNRWMCDLPLLNKRQLMAAGIAESHILLSGLCTACHRETFFSHRGEGGHTGRQLNFVMIRDVGGG